MRTNNRPSYTVMFRKKAADDSAWGIYDGLFSSASEAKRLATTRCAKDEVAEVCELTTVYEVET